MREILFKGKRKDNGEWVKGMLLATDVIIPCGQEFFIEANSIIDAVFTGYEVIPETVGQFTGLTDKNGKKIFEGDIHKCSENLWLVTFGEFYDMDVTDYEYGWYCKKINSKHAETFGFNGAESGYMNIIGNIHDNPELLKGGA